MGLEKFSLSLMKGNLLVLLRLFFGLWSLSIVLQPVSGLRPLRESTQSWGDEVSAEFEDFIPFPLAVKLRDCFQFFPFLGSEFLKF